MAGREAAGAAAGAVPEAAEDPVLPVHLPARPAVPVRPAVRVHVPVRLPAGQAAQLRSFLRTAFTAAESGWRRKHHKETAPIQRESV